MIANPVPASYTMLLITVGHLDLGLGDALMLHMSYTMLHIGLGHIVLNSLVAVISHTL